MFTVKNGCCIFLFDYLGKTFNPLLRPIVTQLISFEVNWSHDPGKRPKDLSPIFKKLSLFHFQLFIAIFRFCTSLRVSVTLLSPGFLSKVYNLKKPFD